MTLESYAINPMGEKNAVMSARDMYKRLYTDKLDKILLREAGKIDYYLYIDNERYFIYIKVPSEVVPKFYYDTIIEFYTDNNSIKNTRSLKDYFIKVYSNDPAYVYTFAHSFIKNDLFIKELESKMSKLAVKKAAQDKNPKNVIGYVKSIYFAYLIIKNKGLYNKIQFETYGNKLILKELLQKVEHADKKIEDRQRAQEMIDKAKKIEKEKISKEKEKNRKQQIANKPSVISNDLKINSSNSIKTTKTVKISTVSSKSNRSKKI